MDTTEQTMALAAKLLHVSQAEAAEYSYYMKDLDAFYFSVPVKGGDSLIIRGEEVLYADSSVSFEDHTQAFVNGMRTPLDAFNAQ